MRWTLAAIALLAAAAAAVGCGTAARSAGTDPPPCMRPARAGTFEVAVDRGGVRRTALVHVPRGVPRTRRLPLYVVFHFAGGTGGEMESASDMSEIADQHRFIAAYPDALPRSRPFWNVTANPSKPDDVGFARALIARLSRSECVDTRRVYATGVSNGGGMAALLACRAADVTTGVAPVAGGYAGQPPCEPSRPVSVLELHGTGETVEPYEGKPPDGRGSVRAFLEGWVRADGCSAGPRTTTLPHLRAQRLEWTGCKHGTAVAHIKLIGAGHGLPPNEPLQGDRSPVHAMDEVVRFMTGRSG